MIRCGRCPTAQLRETIDVRAERVVLAAVRLPGGRHDPEDPFGELRALAEQAGAVVVGSIEQYRKAPEAGTYMGRGKVEELRALCDAVEAQTVIFDHELSPGQIGNLERAIGRKVLDRSELILDIFASRATTHEARLQVELAQLEYTYPRLRAMWDHLERIVGHGGVGGIGTRGPGEQQLETDRRLVQRRRDELRRRLDQILSRKHRAVRRRGLSHFTVALAGYTNAGKSTLFNTLTAGGAYADDRLFATLVSRTRTWELGGGVDVMLSDTVGFVRDLPHDLVASFRATLEEVTHADLVLVVVDVSDRASWAQYQTVQATLDDLMRQQRRRAERSGEPWDEPRRLVVLNKVDRLRDNADVLVWSRRVPDSVAVCALPGPDGGLRVGQDELVGRVRALAVGEVEEVVLRVPMREARAVQAIESRGEVIERQYNGALARFRVRMGRREIQRLAALGVVREGPDGGVDTGAEPADTSPP